MESATGFDLDTGKQNVLNNFDHFQSLPSTVADESYFGADSIVDHDTSGNSMMHLTIDIKFMSDNVLFT